MTALGADVTLVAPPTLLPVSLDGWPVAVSHDLDDVLAETSTSSTCCDSSASARREALFPSLREYTRAGDSRASGRRACARTRSSCTPVPMNRGIEIAADVAEGPASIIVEQVTNGVAVRMAVLYTLLGGGAGAGPGSGSGAELAA